MATKKKFYYSHNIPFAFVYHIIIILFHIGMWATREMSNVENDREMFVRTTIRELVVYCIFLFVLCVCKFLENH